MRISDWSSDVCSSDLGNEPAARPHHRRDCRRDSGSRKPDGAPQARQGRRLCDETDGSAARRPGGSMTGTTQEGSAITMMRKTLLAGMAAFGLAMTAAPAAMAEDVTYLLDRKGTRLNSSH